MQMKLVSLAVATLASTSAMAQVTFYGVLDAGIVRTTGEQAAGSDAKFTGVNGGNLSGNRIGIAVEEDLGGGVKGVGRFEAGSLNIDDTSGGSNGINSTRQSYVGLASETFGSLLIGRLQGPGYEIGIKHAAFNSAIFGPFAILANGAAGSRSITTGGQDARVNNGVEYISPKLGGMVTVKALGARTNPSGELSATQANGNVMGLGAEFSSGPLDVSAVMQQIDEIAVVGTEEADHRDWLVGVNYNFGAAKVFAAYLGTKRDNPVGNDVKGKFYELGVHVPIGMGTIKAAVGRGDKDEVSSTNASDPEAATTIAIDYEHDFTKRTTAWVGVSRTKVGDFSVAPVDPEASVITVTNVSAAADEKILLVGAGLRHKF